MTTPADNETPETQPPQAEASAPAKPVKEKKPLPMWMVLAGIVLFLLMTLGVGYVIWIVANTLQLGRTDTSSMYGNGRVVEKVTYTDIQGMGSELLIDKKADMPARIRFLLRDKDRHPITDAEVSIDMISADDPPQPSTHADLKMKEPGVYRGDVDVPAGGLWEARIRVLTKGDAYQITKRVAVPISDKEKAAEGQAAKDKAKK